MRGIVLARPLVTSALLLAAVPAAAQEWRLIGQVGRVTYPGAPGGGSATSAVLGLTRTRARDWLGFSAGLPVEGGPYWASAAGWRRLQTRGAAGFLLDLSAHGFAQGDPQESADPPPLVPLQPLGSSTTLVAGYGAGAEAMAGAFASSRRLAVEARAGAAGQASEVAGVRSDRLLPAGGLGLTAVLAPFTVRSETRGWLDGDTGHAVARGSVEWGHGPVRLSGSVGRWFAGGVDETEWGIGLTAALGGRVELIAGARGHTFDPLHLTTTDRSAWGGLGVRLGRAAMAAPAPARYEDGRATIRLPAREARGPVSIAGDFNGWSPAPMRRDGGDWVLEVPLAPGVYHYAFVGPDGTWFVPPSVRGRRPDGMGGWVAVLVVQG